jgi:transposase-like protein
MLMRLRSLPLILWNAHSTRAKAASPRRRGELDEQWGNRYPGVIRVWRRAWEEFTPFLGVPPPELRRVVYTTNLVENVHYQLRISHQNKRPLSHRPISSETAAPGSSEHHQQKRRQPRHRHPRLENSPKPTRNPLP